MSEYLLVYSHPTLGEQRFPLEANHSYRIGARSDNDIVIAQKDVSRHHAVLTVLEGRFQVTDLDSKNGTFVNGQRTASAEVSAGDQLALSSATMVIVEVGLERSDEAVPSGLGDAVKVHTDSGDDDTSHHRLAASAEDVVDLLEVTARAIERGVVSAPLRWAVSTLPILSAMVLYQDENGAVAMVASAGDPAPLLGSPGAMAGLIADEEGEELSPGLRVRQVEVERSLVLVAGLRGSHTLVLQYPRHPPAVSDVRALVVATEAVLAAARPGAGPVRAQERTGAKAGGGESRSLDSLAALPLVEARAAFERILVERALVETGGSWSAAARRLGLTRAGFYKLARRLKVQL